MFRFNTSITLTHFSKGVYICCICYISFDMVHACMSVFSTMFKNDHFVTVMKADQRQGAVSHLAAPER